MYHQTNFGCNTHTPHNRALLRCCHEWNRWTVTRLSWKVNTQNSKLKFHIRKFLFPTFVCLLCGPAAAHAHRWRLYQHGQPVSSTQMPESIARASHTHTHSALWFVCIVWLINRNYIALPAVAGFAVRDWLITMCPFGLRFIFPDDWVTSMWLNRMCSCSHTQAMIVGKVRANPSPRCTVHQQTNKSMWYLPIGCCCCCCSCVQPKCLQLPANDNDEMHMNRVYIAFGT